MKLERLDKFLANQALLTRSEARKAVLRGEVTVNGTVTRTADYKVDCDIDTVVLCGETVGYREYLYVMMNKPKGVLSATEDSSRETVVDLVPPQLFKKGMFPVGRLDRDTTGFIIITNDGDFAHRVISPKSGIEKVYEAVLDKPVTPDAVKAFKSGVVLADGKRCLPADLVIDSTDNHRATVTVKEGKYHQIKRMFGTLDLGVDELHRKSIGGVPLDDKLDFGECRALTEVEISRISKQYNNN